MSAMSLERDDLRRRVRDERKRRGWNQQDLANHAGLSKRTVWGFEKGSTWPQEDNLNKILEAVGLQALNKVKGLAPGGADAAAEDEAIRTRTVEGWPLWIKVFLDMEGAHLMAMEESEALEYVRQRTFEIWSSRRA